MSTVTKLDLKSVLNKRSNFFKYPPMSWLIFLLRWLICEKQINKYLAKEYLAFDFIDFYLRDKQIKTKVYHINNLPSTRNILFVANHPLAGLDGLILLSCLKDKYPNIQFPVNDFLLSIKQLESIFFPINKHGSNEKNYSQLVELFASEKPIAYFPAGLCSRKAKGKIRDLSWHKSSIKLARGKRIIVPIYISGSLSKFFYGLAWFRKFLHIKFNFEMLCLPREFFALHNKTIDLYIGQPIDTSTLGSALTDSQVTEQIYTYLYKLEKFKNVPFSLS